MMSWGTGEEMGPMLLYHWDGLYCEIDSYYRSCEEYQKRRPHQFDHPLHPMFLNSAVTVSGTFRSPLITCNRTDSSKEATKTSSTPLQSL